MQLGFLEKKKSSAIDKAQTSNMNKPVKTLFVFVRVLFFFHQSSYR